MKRPIRTRLLLFALLALLSVIGAADDTDIFNQPPGSNPPAPNILFILDNRPNWSSQSQHWPDGSTQGEAELNAIKSFIANINQPANIGLMMLGVANHDGGYVRYGLRSMTDTANNAAMQNILQSVHDSITSPSEKINQASGNFANALYEAWLYFTGANSWEGMSPKADYAGNASSPTPASLGLNSGFAYQGSAQGARYNNPIASGSCAKTYIIFVGNNDQKMPEAPGSADPSVTTLKQYNYTTAPDVQSAWARFLRMRPDLGSNAGGGAVTTYTIDAYSSKPNPIFSAMMQNMAHGGGGQYYVATDTASMQLALQKIFNQIQAVNTVFSAVSLPVSVSVRSTYLNQVYMGMFRPDAHAAPNWVGNLKQYQLGVNTATNPPTLFLADRNGADAENPATGFINPDAVSFWTASSAFWNPTYYPTVQGAGGASDSPDGDLVEKGGAAEFLRQRYATGQTTPNNRPLYTCVDACTNGSALSATPFATSTAWFQTAAAVTAFTPSGDTITQADEYNTINWVRGGNYAPTIDDDPNSTQVATDVRGHLHGDVVHSRPAVINYGGADNIMVFYGANDGILHAVKGGQPAAGAASQDGQELWGFVAPEFFSQLKRLRDHSPIISSSSPKPYFFDGSITTYTYSTANDGVISASRGDKAYLFVSMRRGGRLMYALDVSDPTNPRLLWKHSNADAGFSELGYTWSDLKVAKLKAYADPVLIAGMGYDPGANDPTVQGVAAMGRGVMIIDALNGALLWQAGPAPSGAQRNIAVSGMTYAIPASMELVDSNGDGYIDRIYAADTGANLWRINVDNADPGQWTLGKIASLGGAGANARKFFYPPDVVLASSTQAYDAVLLGSGDREHPFDTTIVNQFYMIEDSHDLNALATPVATQASPGNLDGYTVRNLYDATANLIQVGDSSQQAAASAALLAAGNRGWYVTLGSGEKVVSGSTTLGGSVIFGANLPAAASSSTCTSNLGEARLYSLNYLTGGATIDQDQNGALTTADRYLVHPGGGYPPTPIPISVVINGRTYQAAISGTYVVSPPGPPLGRRYRTYWYRTID